MRAKVSVSKVKDEALGEVHRVFVRLPDGLSPVGFWLWKCPLCEAEIKAWTLGQLTAAVKSHKMRRSHGKRRKYAGEGGEP